MRRSRVRRPEGTTEHSFRAVPARVPLLSQADWGCDRTKATLGRGHNASRPVANAKNTNAARNASEKKVLAAHLAAHEPCPSGTELAEIADDRGDVAVARSIPGKEALVAVGDFRAETDNQVPINVA